MKKLKDIYKDAVDAFKKEVNIGGETVNRSFYKGREAGGLGDEGTPMEERLGRNLLISRIRENLGIANRAMQEERVKMGIGLEKGPVRRTVQLGGNAVRDILNDDTRGLWWYINALPAVGELLTQEAHRRAKPELYKRGAIKDNKGKDASGALRLLPVPAGIAINTGLGLMSPFGGAEGYKAAIPSKEDPTKTENMLGEIALKYFMGRTGNLLPYEEFRKVRPDVSPAEFGKYKAFKYDKNEDWNPVDDGQITMLAGALKYTNEGIHGPEVQFLGRGLPVTTGVVPFVGSVLGGVGGLRSRAVGKGAITAGTLGGFAGLGAGQIVGNAIEQERRRRNLVENELNGEL